MTSILLQNTCCHLSPKCSRQPTRPFVRPTLTRWHVPFQKLHLVRIQEEGLYVNYAVFIWRDYRQLFPVHKATCFVTVSLPCSGVYRGRLLCHSSEPMSERRKLSEIRRLVRLRMCSWLGRHRLHCWSVPEYKKDNH